MAKREKEVYPAPAQFMTHHFYVDDELGSVQSVEQAEGLIQGAREICKSGGRRLHKFVSTIVQYSSQYQRVREQLISS